ncbi:hypothetical protein D4764_18G0010320 [Takifugu flavidus]|uniref:Hypocretin neuropeptide precursor n=1 Tax=Takifugu flavidus TaxID=433684 RepID=A0A5C6NTC3_9TELE|nr:hypothetical protein D4764_18G0010320 [Takifugu flavidus]
MTSMRLTIAQQYKRHLFQKEDQKAPNQKMTWFPTNIQKGTRMSDRQKVPVLLFLLLLSQLACDAHSVSECCRQPPHSCRLYVLLCRSGGMTLGGPLTGDAAAGILTLGKRKEEGGRFQSRLHQLLHGSRSQAAGILTMGKRTEEEAGEPFMDWTSSTTSPPV